MDFTIVGTYLPFLLSGVAVTVLVSAVSFVLGMTLGLVLAFLRLSSLRALRFAAILYIDFVRSTPILVQLTWLFFVMPIVLGIYLDPLPIGILCLGLHFSAFAAEIYRAGILAVPTGQREAALAQGMTDRQAMRRIVVPQAIRKVLLPMASMAVSLVLDASLLSVIAVPELLSKANSVASFTIRPLEVWSLVALIYMALTLPLTFAVNAVHRRAVHIAGGQA